MELTLPEKIQLLRKRIGMNQGQFGAKAFNTSEETGRTKIKNIELGKQKPTRDDLVQMANVLNVSPSMLHPSATKNTVGPGAKGQGLVVEQAVMDRFYQLGPYLEMLNRAAIIKDEELIDHIAGKLADVFALGRQQLEAINS